LDDLGDDPNGFIAMEWRSLIDQWDPTSFAAAKTALTVKCQSPSMVLRHLGDWALISMIGWDEYKKVAVVHASTLARTRKVLQEAGIFPGSPSGLPELQIHRLYVDW
jgi:hypothetical protein